MVSTSVPKQLTPDAEKGVLKSCSDAADNDAAQQVGQIMPVHEEILDSEELGTSMAAKMFLLNEAINEIGWTALHSKLFVLNGFGYAVDSLLALLQSVIASQAFLELGTSGTDFANALTIALYSGLFTGALFWGCYADIIGRRWGFNITLLISSVATIVAGAAPSWLSLGFFVACLGFGAGGNLVLDPTVFLEFLPARQQWAVTAMACWWGIGQAAAGFIAWIFLTRKDMNCDVAHDCTWDNNQGWRLVMFVAGGVVLLMSVARVTVVRLDETPKHLVCVGRDEEAVETLQKIAREHGRPCSLTVEKMRQCGGDSETVQKGKGISAGVLVRNVGSLFRTKKLGLSTSMVWLSWAMVGLAYPLFYLFLPTYLTSRIKDGQLPPFETWRNYTLVNISAIFGPLLAAWLVNVRQLGRRYTMAIGAVLTMAFFLGNTASQNRAQNVGLNCAISFSVNVYYGTLYAYTVEVFPSNSRATGNGIAVALNRVMGILSAVVAYVADTSSVVPLYLCAGLYAASAIAACSFPFEPRRARAS